MCAALSALLASDPLLLWYRVQVAAGHRLPETQEEINAMVRGHALEARIYAENPNK